jgi:hypothetical protein
MRAFHLRLACGRSNSDLHPNLYCGRAGGTVTAFRIRSSDSREVSYGR